VEESGEHDMLIGEYHHNIDDKNRLVIPSKFRADIGSKFILTRGLDKCLFIYSLEEWNSIVAELKKLPFTHKDSRYFTRFFLSGAIECELDNAGRVCITSPLIEYADITKECVIIGANDRLEVWSKESWDKFLSDNSEEFENIAENLFNEGGYNAL
jgi:MraZ protein